MKFYRIVEEERCVFGFSGFDEIYRIEKYVNCIFFGFWKEVGWERSLEAAGKALDELHKPELSYGTVKVIKMGM